MYAWLWRHLPGPLPVRLITTVLLVIVIVVLLFAYVFPWLEPLMPFSGNTTVH
jgi:hypothetical protein